MVVDDDLPELIEERRRATLDLIYATPGISMAAQAFIFTISLDPSTSNTARIVAAVVGVVAGIATALSIVKHNYTETMYGAALDAIRQHQGKPLVHRKELEKLANLAKNREYARWDTGWRSRAKARGATDLWVYGLIGFALVDVLVLALAIVDATGIWHPVSGR